jgi:predicted protein tyrosine phosphatase
MSADSALALKEPTRILRVAFRHSNYQGFNISHKAVKEVFVEPDARIPDETCQQIVEFIEEAVAAGDDIVIHCTEGRYRSRAIANFVWRHYEDYEHTGKPWEGGEMRDHNYRSLQEWYVANRKESANV